MIVRGNFWARFAVGAAAGMAGTMVLQAIRTTNQKWIPEGSAPIAGDPGEFMVSKAKQALPEEVKRRLPGSLEKSITKSLPLAYGMAFGAGYAGARPGTRRAVAEGVLLGLFTWAVGYLGWLPRTRLMPPVWKHKPKQVIVPIVEHALYGVATVEGYRWLKHAAHV